MRRSPVERLNLPAFPAGDAYEGKASPTAWIAGPEFPPEAAAATDVGGPAFFSESGRSAGAGVVPDVITGLEEIANQPAPDPLSGLERYRLENQRELLRRIAFQRHFQNGGM